MPLSPTQLTLRKLRAEGYRADIVEHWNQFARVRKDLFGIIDVLGVRYGQTIGVQCTTFGNRLSSVKKMVESDAIGDLRDADWTLEVHGWRKVKNRWVCTTEDVS